VTSEQLIFSFQPVHILSKTEMNGQEPMLQTRAPESPARRRFVKSFVEPAPRSRSDLSLLPLKAGSTKRNRDNFNYWRPGKGFGTKCQCQNVGSRNPGPILRNFFCSRSLHVKMIQGTNLILRL
jgi:hypothetical protein